MSNVIFTTDNYAKFKLLAYNRPVREYHVRDLMKSFEEHPHLRPTRPVLLNEKHEIIDGQHRVEAAKRLGIDTYYMVVEGLTIADARLLNALQRTWSLIDYAESYAADGHTEYVRFMDYYEEYKLPAMALVAYMSGKQDQGMRSEFKLGKFRATDRKIIDEYLQKLEDFSEFTDSWREERFALAAFTLFRHDKYDHKRMMEKMGKARLIRQPARLEYLRELENIYNSDTRLENRVRFF